MSPSTASPSTRKTEDRSGPAAWLARAWRGAGQAARVFRAAWAGYWTRRCRLPGLRLPTRTGLLVLALLLLAGTSLLVLRRPAPPLADPAGFNLLAGSSSSKLNNTSAEAHADPAAAAPPVELDVARDAAVAALATSGLPKTPAPPTEQRAPLDAATGNAATVVEPDAVHDLAIQSPHRGDDTMRRHWTQLGLHLALATAFATTPGRAAQFDGPAPAAPAAPAAAAAEPDSSTALARQLQEQVSKKLDDIEKRLKEAIQGSDTNANLKFARIQTDLDDIRKQLGQIARLQADSDDIKRQIAQLRQDLDGLRNRSASPQVSASLYPTTPANTARVRLVNTYLDPMTILVNDRAYRLAPGETRLTDPLPAGSFTYQVLGVQTGQQTRTLSPNETFTITVHPQ